MNSFGLLVRGSALLFAATLVAGCTTPTDDGDDHLNAVGVEVATLDGVRLATYSGGVWTFTSGDALHLHPDEELGVRIFFLEADGDRRELPTSDAEITLRVEIEDPTIAAFEPHGDHGDFVGRAVGETRAAIQAFHGGHPDFETNPGLPIEVVAD